MIETTSHPKWIYEFLSYLEPYKNRVVNHKIFEDLGKASLPIKKIQYAQINFYPLIESFPLYMGLNLVKVPAGSSLWNQKTRHWIIENINQERRHMKWWKNFAIGFGVADEVFRSAINPPPEMDSINNFLWRICSHGSLIEGMSALNFTIVKSPAGIIIFSTRT